MQVKLKAYSPKYRDLTPGNVYRVIGIEADDFRIMNDVGQPYLYPHRLFRVVDASRNPDWQRTVGTEGEEYAYPRALAAPGFFEDYFDRSPAAVEALHTYLRSSPHMKSKSPKPKPRRTRAGQAA